jgi:hypothetical protein
VLSRLAQEGAVGRAAVDDEHVAVDASDFRVGPGHLTGTVIDAEGAKSALDRIRIAWITADHAVSVDRESGVVVEDDPP